MQGRILLVGDESWSAPLIGELRLPKGAVVVTVDDIRDAQRQLRIWQFNAIVLQANTDNNAFGASIFPLLTQYRSMLDTIVFDNREKNHFDSEFPVLAIVARDLGDIINEVNEALRFGDPKNL